MRRRGIANTVSKMNRENSAEYFVAKIVRWAFKYSNKSLTVFKEKLVLRRANCYVTGC